jgi:hypothetical protein
LCKPKEYGGIGILNLTKFALALRIRWLWHDWNEEAKSWVRLGTPCTPQYVELFAAATLVTIGNGRKTPFLGSLMDQWKKAQGYCPSLKSQKGKKFHS